MNRLALLLPILLVVGCSGDSEEPEGLAESKESTELGAVETWDPMPSTFVKYSAKDFFSSTSIFGSAINLDGTAVLITTDESGIYNTYRQPLGEGEREALTRSETDTTKGVSFFPADDRVLLTADQEGNELNHLYVRELDGAIHDITPGKNLKAAFVNWTIDGSAFFVKTNERDPRFLDLYRYKSSGYSRERVFKNDDGWIVSAVSDDGQWLALRKIRNKSDSDIYLLNLMDENSKPGIITAHMGRANHFAYTFTRDSETLVYGADGSSDFVQAWSHRIVSKQKSKLAEGDWDVSDVSYSKDGRYQVVTRNIDAANSIEITDTSTGKVLPLPELPAGNVSGVNFSPDNTLMVFYIDAENNPANLYVYGMDDDEIEPLTQALNRNMDTENLVVSRVVSFKSEGAIDIPSLLYKPYAATPGNPSPALIWIHGGPGGPGGQSKKGYRAEIQHLVNQGYAVLAVNNRGSSGYGKKFYHLDDRKHGEADLKDIVAAKAYLQSLSWVEKERIGVIGTGYGGYLTMAAMTFTDEFKVGIDIFGVMNWERTLKNIPPWWTSIKDALYDEMGDPANDQERHRRISPLFHADRITKPVLIAQGANDPRVLQVESDEMVEAIRVQEVPVEYVLFVDEGHGFRKKENRIKAQTAYFMFLERYL